MKKIVSICFFAFCFLLSYAQTDSVWMEGRVTDAATGEPQSLCEVQLHGSALHPCKASDSEASAIAFCDDQGYFSIGWVPVGVYTLSVLSEGKTLHYAELKLEENAMVNIALMNSDTVMFRALRTVTVTETKHKLGDRLITSPDDPRLWNFNNNPILYGIGPASSSCGNSRGADYFSDKRNLAAWRPAWLDAPFTKKVKITSSSENQKKD